MPSGQELYAGFFMWAIVSPIFIVIGNVGNIISVCVFSRPDMYKRPSSAAFIALAVTDLLVLDIFLLSVWVEQLMHTDLMELSSGMCKMYNWFLHSSVEIAVWFLVVINIQRAIATACPHRYRTLCSKRRTCIAFSTTAVSLLVMNSHFLVGLGDITLDTGNSTVIFRCVPLSPSYARFLTIWPIIQLFKLSLLPFVLILSGSLCIMLVLCKRWRQVECEYSNGSLARTSLAIITSTSKVLLAVNLVFLCSTAPFTVYVLLDRSLYTEDIPLHMKTRKPGLAAVGLLTNVNHVVNFFLYCLVSSKFRSELKQMFGKRVTMVLHVQSVQTAREAISRL